MTKLATVSYLNARPLIDGLERETDIDVIRRVPSRLLEILETGNASIALCPVIDFQHSETALEIVPAGAIGCDGPALTVKLFGVSEPQSPLRPGRTGARRDRGFLEAVPRTRDHRRVAADEGVRR